MPANAASFSKIPRCFGIIMDGNRRFARERGLPLLEGHRRGYEKLKEFLGWADKAGVKHVVAYAFSTENWKRAEEEVSYLLDLFRHALTNEAREINRNRGAVRFVGDLARFPQDIQSLMRKVEKETKNNQGLVLHLAISYGGRAEILSAVERARKAPAGVPMTEESFARYLQTGDMPDPDLIIRTGGEERLSNFLPWQSVYSELFFVPTYWPAFSKTEFEDILKRYGKRDRRFGQ